MKVKRAIYFVFGATFLSLGAIGVVLPLLPTTPFVILAALCFGKSSERAEKWILSNKYLEPILKTTEIRLEYP